MAGPTQNADAERNARPDRQALIFLAAIGLAFAVGYLAVKHRELALAASIGGAVMVWALRSPLSIYLLFIIGISLEIEGLHTGLVSYTGLKAVGAMAVIAWLTRWLVRGEFRLRRHAQSYIFFAFFALLCLNSVIARDLENTFSSLISWAQLIIFFLMTQSLIDTRARLVKTYWVMVATMAGGALMGFFQTMAGERAHGFIIDPNTFCLFLIIAAYLGMGLLLSYQSLAQRSWQQTVLLALLFTIGAGIITSGSRGGFLSLAISGGLCLVLLGMKMRGLVLVLALGATFMMLAPEKYWSRIQTLRNPSKDASLTGRLFELQAGLRMIRRHPVQGVGTGNFTSNYVYYSSDTRRRPRVAHNMYIHLGAENGLVGLTVFLSLIGYTLYRFFRMRMMLAANDPQNLSPLIFGAMLALVGFLLGAIFLSAHFEKYFYMLLGIMPVLDRLSRESLQPAAEGPPLAAETA